MRAKSSAIVHIRMEDQLCGKPQWCDPPRDSQDHISPQQLAKELLLLEVLADGGGGEVSIFRVFSVDSSNFWTRVRARAVISSNTFKFVKCRYSSVERTFSRVHITSIDDFILKAVYSLKIAIFSE